MLRDIRLRVAFILLGCLLAALIGFALTGFGNEEDHYVGLRATAELNSPSGEPIGAVTFIQAATGVLVQAEAEGLSPGGHAFIVHSVGACAPDFSAAGDHFNPENVRHGFVHPNWNRRDVDTRGHGGDLPNIYAAADGSARADFFTTGFTLREDENHSIFDSDGSAIIVHEEPDAYGEHESDTGERVACGVIEPA